MCLLDWSCLASFEVSSGLAVAERACAIVEAMGEPEAAATYPGDIGVRPIAIGLAIATVACAVGIGLTGLASEVPYGIAMLYGLMAVAIALPFAGVLLARPRIVVGQDAVELVGAGRRRVIPWASVEAIEKARLEVRLRLKDGRRVHLSSTSPRRYERHEPFRNLVAHLRRAFEAHRSAPAPTFDATRLAPPSDDAAQWRASLDALARGDYRDAPLTREQLVELLESPATSELVRIGAAAALLRAADDADRDRVRVVSNACVIPRVRVALDELMESVDEPAVLKRALRGSRSNSD